MSHAHCNYDNVLVIFVNKSQESHEWINNFSDDLLSKLFYCLYIFIVFFLKNFLSNFTEIDAYFVDK